MEGERGTMRRLSIPAALVVFLAMAVPAWAARPTTTYEVTWTVDGGTVTLDTATNEVSFNVDSSTQVICSGATAFMTIRLLGSGPATVDVDRQGRIGSFSGTFALDTVVIDGGCNGGFAGGPVDVSASFETDKGKADRWRDDAGRYILRSGQGTLSIDSMMDMPTGIEALTTITS